MSTTIIEMFSRSTKLQICAACGEKIQVGESYISVVVRKKGRKLLDQKMHENCNLLRKTKQDEK